MVAGCGQAETPVGAPAAEPTANPLLGQPDRATGSPVRIGLFNVEGNPLSDYPAVGDSAEAAAAYANEYLGGLDGHVIEIDRCGDNLTPASAQACGNEFVRDGATAVVSGVSATSDAIVPTIVGAGIPWVGATPLSASEISSSNAFFMGAGFLGTLAAWAQYSRDVGYRKVVIFGVDSPVFSAQVEALGRPLFDRAGVALQLVLVPLGTTDTTSYVEEALSDNPDAVAVLTNTSVCQSLLTSMHSAGATQPRLVTSACVEQSVINTVGEAVINNAIVFNQGDPSGNHPEAQLYRSVMQQYAPDTDTSGITLVGYMTMLGLVRAVNAGGLPDGDEVTSDAIMTALRSARDVPRPVGDSGTFSCDRSAISSPTIKATICTSELLYTTYTGGLPGRYGKIDVAPIANG